MVAVTLTLNGTDAMHALGSHLGQHLPIGSILLLNGDLGSGKTTLIQGVGQGLGITDAIASPTFTLICEYLEGRVPLYHFDLYRLDANDIAGLQPELYWEGQDVDPGIVAIEWADRLPYLPPHYLQVDLQYAGQSLRSDELAYPARQVTFIPHGPDAEQSLASIDLQSFVS